MVAAGQFPEFLHDGLAVEEELVADDTVGDEHDEQVAFDGEGVRVAGVGLTDEFGPFLADAMFERIMADAVLDQQLVDDGAEVGRLAALRAAAVRRHLAEVCDKVLDRAGEFLGLGGHDSEVSHKKHRRHKMKA